MKKYKKINDKPTKKRPIKAVVLCSIAFVLTLSLGYWAGSFFANRDEKQLINNILPIRENNFNYKFIDPLLGYEFHGAKNFLEDRILEGKINDYINTQYENNSANGIGVYFRNLSNNKWASVNGDVQYHPGSMMKVLIMIAYFRESQLNPPILYGNLLYDQKTAQESTSLNFSQPTNLVVGQSYTKRYLLEDMIENSDNGAENLLIDNVNRKILDDAYTDLNIQNPDTMQGDYTISASQYAAFLRILYNATYLTEANSEQVLSIMSKSTFTTGISAGVPQGIQVAQKYGERVDSDTTNKNVAAIELNNCGIIYADAYPYELCIMTKKNYSDSTDEQTLSGELKDISSLVYTYVSTGADK